MDREWVLGYLREAMDLLDRMRWSGNNSPMPGTRAAVEEFNTRLLHLRSVVRQVMPGLETNLKQPRWAGEVGSNRTALQQAIYALKEGAEVMRRLGPPPGPSLRADTLHPAVWDAAKSFWRSNHRSQAVESAANAVNAMLQERVGRRDVSNKALVEQAFSLGAPEPGKPRLRVREDDGSEGYRSAQGGALQFGAGCFMALRNPAAHENGELGEQEALEQLAAFSILARWVDGAKLVEAE